MILRDGRDWQPTIGDIHIFKNCYPNIDVENELRKMEGWCHSNPAKRKTRTGIRRFINAWLSNSRPTPVSTSTRDRTLEQDLTDTSWAGL
jgi:hypothetical protein